MTASISPFAKADPKLPIRKGAPLLSRPTKEEIEIFPTEAQQLLETTWQVQQSLLETGKFDLDWLEGRHLLLAGATGPGLGGALASAILGSGQAASLTVLGRDPKCSLNFETGQAMERWAAELTIKFKWINKGMALEGLPLENLVEVLKGNGAERLVYFNSVAAALSGLLPNLPPVFVKDVDENGNLFQWQLTPLDRKAIQVTRYVMGEMAVQLPGLLEARGIRVEASVFADWRGSLDKIGRDPSQPEYGRQGAYSTSLYLPKDVLQAYTKASYGTGRRVFDIFYPIMRTRALPLIPGGLTMAGISDTLLAQESIRRRSVPELALSALDYVGKALTQGYDNPFPRLDSYDAHLDEWFYEVVARLNNDENSDFYFERWL